MSFSNSILTSQSPDFCISSFGSDSTSNLMLTLPSALTVNTGIGCLCLAFVSFVTLVPSADARKHVPVLSCSCVSISDTGHLLKSDDRGFGFLGIGDNNKVSNDVFCCFCDPH